MPHYLSRDATHACLAGLDQSAGVRRSVCERRAATADRFARLGMADISLVCPRSEDEVRRSVHRFRRFAVEKGVHCTCERVSEISWWPVAYCELCERFYANLLSVLAFLTKNC